MSYVKAAKELPFLSPEEVEREAIRYGLVDTVSRGAQEVKLEKVEDTEI